MAPFAFSLSLILGIFSTSCYVYLKLYFGCRLALTTYLISGLTLLSMGALFERRLEGKTSKLPVGLTLTTLSTLPLFDFDFSLTKIRCLVLLASLFFLLVGCWGCSILEQTKTLKSLVFAGIGAVCAATLVAGWAYLDFSLLALQSTALIGCLCITAATRFQARETLSGRRASRRPSPLLKSVLFYLLLVAAFTICGRLIDNQNGSEFSPTEDRSDALLALLPLSLNPTVERILLIGSVAPETLQYCLRSSVKEIDILNECSPTPSQNDKRIRIISSGTIAYLSQSSIRYDLILRGEVVQDPFQTMESLEFFQLCRDHMSPGAAYAQIVPLDKVPSQKFWSLLTTFRDSFSSGFLSHSASKEAVLLGLNVSPELEAAPLEPELLKRAEVVGLGSTEEVLATLVLEIGQLGEALDNVPKTSLKRPFRIPKVEPNQSFDPYFLIQKWPFPLENIQVGNVLQSLREKAYLYRVYEFAKHDHNHIDFFLKSKQAEALLAALPSDHWFFKATKSTDEQQRYFEQKTPSVSASMNLARIAYLRGDDRLAESHLKSALEQEKNPQGRYYVLAYTIFLLQDSLPKKVVEDLKRKLKMLPPTSPYLEDLMKEKL